MPRSISLLIPCYNAAAFLPVLVKSALEQTVPFDEIICFDDGSTDDTLTVATQLGLKVIRSAINKGPSYARNKLIEAATGEWLHFHDADDILNPSFVEVMKSSISSDNIQILCNAQYLGKNEELLDARIEYNLMPQQDPVLFFLQHPGLAIVGLYNRKYLLENSIRFSEHLRFNEDPDFHVKLAYSGAKFYSVKRVLVFIKGHDASASRSKWWSCISNQIFCNMSYIDMLRNPAYQCEINANLTSLCYYCLRSGKRYLGYRAYYVLKNRFSAKPVFRNRKLQLLQKIIPGNFILRSLLYFSK